MKKSFCLLLACMFIVGLWSCSKDDNPAPPNTTVSFAATLNGASEIPANPSTATGDATGTFDTYTKMLSVTVTHNISAPTAGHIHVGPVAGPPGPVVFPFTSLTSPIHFTTAAALNATQEADLMNNLYYVNIHTAAYPAGEIRGQLLKQ